MELPDPPIAQSARRHHIEDEDMRHAFRNPIWVEPVDEDGLEMFIGPSRAANILEVGVVEGDEGPVIVHAMKARDKFLYGR